MISVYLLLDFILQHFNISHRQKELYVLWEPSFFLYHHPYIFPKNLGSYKEKSYICRRKALKKNLWDIKKIL